MSEDVERYETHVSNEPLSIIRSNECDHHLTELATHRFRRMWNEIADRDALIKEMAAALDALKQPDEAAVERAARNGVWSAGDSYLEKGSYYWTADIDWDGTRDHGGIIQCYGEGQAEAEALRDRVLATLQADGEG